MDSKTKTHVVTTAMLYYRIASKTVQYNTQLSFLYAVTMRLRCIDQTRGQLRPLLHSPAGQAWPIPAVGPLGRNDESHRKETNRDNQPLDQLALADGTFSRCTRSRASLDEWISSFLKVLGFNYNERPGGRVI